MKEYILNLEKEFSLIENGFKEEEQRALADYQSNDNVYTKELAFLAFKSNVYQVRMYSVFLFGYLSSYEEILIFMRDEVSKDDNWRVQEVLAKAFDENNPPKGNGFSGITLAYNVEHKEDVDAVIALVRKAGGKIVKEPQEVFWGGYHAYFSDLDGYYWEVSWGPNFQFDENGLLKF
ncbi:VOC family protein [Streptococcus sp. W151]